MGRTQSEGHYLSNGVGGSSSGSPGLRYLSHNDIVTLPTAFPHGTNDCDDATVQNSESLGFECSFSRKGVCKPILADGLGLCFGTGG